MKNNVTLQVKWVPSKECLADPISRWVQDRGDYTLNPKVFKEIPNLFQAQIILEVDLFASPGNSKLKKFVSRWPHWQSAAVDALLAPLDSLGKGFYCNPSWSIIGKFLLRLREYPSLQFLMVAHYWVSATWWPQLIKMKVPRSKILRITPFKSLFSNCWGQEMPPPRWDLVCILCSGKFWKEKNSGFLHHRLLH